MLPLDTSEQEEVRKMSKGYSHLQKTFYKDKVDVLGSLQNETASCTTVALPSQIQLEDKIYALMLRCQEYCPHIYGKLHKYLRKFMAKHYGFQDSRPTMVNMIQFITTIPGRNLLNKVVSKIYKGSHRIDQFMPSDDFIKINCQKSQFNCLETNDNLAKKIINPDYGKMITATEVIPSDDLSLSDDEEINQFSMDYELDIYDGSYEVKHLDELLSHSFWSGKDYEMIEESPRLLPITYNKIEEID